MRTILLAAAATITMSASSLVIADDTAIIKQAMNNLSHEFSDCWVFYQISMECMRNRTDSAETIAKYQKVSEYALAMSLEFGKNAGISHDALIARHTLASRDMMRAIESNCSNISVLLVKYLDSCKALVEEDVEPMISRAVDQARKTVAK